MGFFPDPEFEPGAVSGDRAEPSGPDWSGSAADDYSLDAPPTWWQPDEDVVPGAVERSVILARSSEVAAFLTAMRAYPNGLAMLLIVRARDGSEDLVDVHGEPVWEDQRRPGRLKWGFEYADGRRVTNVHPPLQMGWPLNDVDPVLIARGGSSTNRTVEIEYWLGPLPIPGPITVACEWLDRDVAFTSQTIDAEVFLDAASRAIRLWPQP